MSPTQIWGKLIANGQIYLINQNGILFEKGSQVDVHTLIASSLDIADSDFMNGTLNFTARDYQQTGNTYYLNASVINQGPTATDAMGSVSLLGPSVTNGGTIGTLQTQVGQIGLAAGTDISLFHDTTIGSTRTALVVSVTQNPGQATNYGQMLANTGLIGMYGENVVQNGVITAITALKAKRTNRTRGVGHSVHRLRERHKSPPISTSKETADQSFGFLGGTITIEGLDPSSPMKPALGVDQIVNCGSISAPSGIVNMTAQDRVYLENGSSINVNGSWIRQAAAANTTQVQLNSVNLRDDPDQKGGILQGATVTVNNLLGSSIGDISGSLNTEQQTALQRSLQGGQIYVASQGDVIVKQGASVDFSGGGSRYNAGYITTTDLVSGNKIYAISNAPETLHYNRILNLTSYMSSYVEGATAGTLSLAARQIVLDGNIKGAATAGAYQTSKSELSDAFGDPKTLGLQIPQGGTLIIGVPFTSGLVEGHDCLLNSVVLESMVAPLPSTFGPGDQPYDPNALSTTYLSTQKLSAAGLSNLQIAANLALTVTGDADISLRPGATLTLDARAIDFYGKINVPSGIVNLTAIDNVTAFPPLDGSSSNPRYVPLDSQIYLANGSQINAAGQHIDNSLASSPSGGAAPFTYITGGFVTIQNESYLTQGVIAAAGSLIDVSGGYGISRTGVVTGGNAGSLFIQGAGIVLDGKLKGYSIQGNNGGIITLDAQSITVAPSAQSNQNPDSMLVLGQHQLDDTGFTQINLQSANDTVIETGVSLSPSLVKLSTPIPGGRTKTSRLVSVAPYLIGKSSFSAVAGTLLTTPATGLPQFTPPIYQPNDNAAIQVLAGSQVNVAPGGSISLKAPVVTVGGALSAPAGTVSITATQSDVTLQGGGTISATGLNERSLKPVMPGNHVSYTALPGGIVKLSAPNGSVITEADSLVDVSGSPSVKTWLLNGNGVPKAQKLASNPGSITISALNLSSNGNSTLQGTLEGKAKLPGLQGGTLSIASMSLNSGYTLSNSDFASYLAGGFDALTFSSYKALVFSGSMNFTVGRSLTLDAPYFTELGSDQLKVQAPSITLQDTYLMAWARRR